MAGSASARAGRAGQRKAGAWMCQTARMKRPSPIRDPSYNLPTVDPENATPAERALAALKIGAILAAVVTIVLIYVGTYGGLEGQQDLVSLAVLVAFVAPSLLTWAWAWYRRLRSRGREQ